MRRVIPALAAATLMCGCVHLAPDVPGPPAGTRTSHSTTPDADRHRLKPFESPEQIARVMASVEEARRVAHEKELAQLRAQCREWAKSDVAITIECSSPIVQTVTVSGAKAQAITNNQHAGVDEGDIVKRQGDVLIVLRRGRLFTIGIGGSQLDSLAVADAFGPASDGIEPDHTWYDELLVWQRTVIVIGYSYKRGGTEIGLFDLDDDGGLEYRTTYHVRSDDYYSRENYASRLIGDRLVLFTSLWLRENVDPNTWLPALRRWNPQGVNGPFETIAPINRVFQPVAPLGANPSIHSLIICDLTVPSLECEATVVLGDHLSVYYASPTAAYAWTSAWSDGGQTRAMLYRIPFDGEPVSAIGVSGVPPDQLAFFEDAQDHLNVVAAHDDHVVRLLRVPLHLFSDGSLEAPSSYYRPLARGPWVIARFVGDYLLVGTPTYEPDEKRARRVVVTKRDGTSTVSLELTHTVDRIEAMGTHALIVGTDEQRLSMTAVRLGSRPATAGTFVHEYASQSEYRSHAFFYRRDRLDAGMFGVPITVAGTDDDGDRWDRPTAILFVRSRGLALSAVGRLDPSKATHTSDGCRASCVDWYGNARPIFIEDRILALSGYEVVEGRLVENRLEHATRLDFTPKSTR
jgi:hypothetical protein